ncbi:MAG: hypothetical protein RL760_1494 [Candidatus Eisenbacteria bacterium]
MRASTLHRLVTLALCLVLALPAGCVNPFKPSDPERPDGTGVPENFGTTDDLLQTLQLAVESKSLNGENAWVHAFSDSVTNADRAYRHFYDPAVKQTWQTGTSLTAPEPWDLTLERGLPRFLFGVRQNLGYAWQWGFDSYSTNDEEAADTALVHRKYTLVASNGSQSEVIAIGYCDLSLQRKSGRWWIVNWNDRVDPTIGANPSNDQRTMTWWRLQSLTRQ